MILSEAPQHQPTLTDEDHARVWAPGFVRRRQNGVVDPVVANQAERLAEIRNDHQPLTLQELEAARNKALRGMLRRIFEMKPSELMEAVELLDGEISAKKVTNSSEGEKTVQATRQEMIEKLQGNLKVQK